MKTRVNLLLLSCLLLIAGCDNEPANDPGLVPNQDFILEDLNGQPFQMSSTAGKVVMLNFFSPSCVICQGEAQELNEVYLEFRNQGFEVVGISINSGSIADVEAFVSQYNIPYTVVVGDRDPNDFQVLQLFYGLSGTPKATFINRDGFIVDEVQGGKSKALIESIIEPLL